MDEHFLHVSRCQDSDGKCEEKIFNCPGIAISSQEDIDEYCKQNFRCQIFNGDLEVARSYNGTAIDFSGCRMGQIENDFIVRSGQLASLVAPDLVTVRGSVDVSNNNELTQVSTTLEEVRGNIAVMGNPKLNTFFSELKHVGGSFTLSNNANLQEIPVMEEFKSIGGSMAILDNARLEDVPWRNLDTVGGSFEISSNPQLRNVRTAFLASLGGSFVLNSNAMQAASNFGAKIIGGDLIISNNPKLGNARFDLPVQEGSDRGPLEVVQGSVEIVNNAQIERIGPIAQNRCEHSFKLDPSFRTNCFNCSLKKFCSQVKRATVLHTIVLSASRFAISKVLVVICALLIMQSYSRSICKFYIRLVVI